MLCLLPVDGLPGRPMATLLLLLLPLLQAKSPPHEALRGSPQRRLRHGLQLRRCELAECLKYWEEVPLMQRVSGADAPLAAGESEESRLRSGSGLPDTAQAGSAGGASWST